MQFINPASSDQHIVFATTIQRNGNRHGLPDRDLVDSTSPVTPDRRHSGTIKFLDHTKATYRILVCFGIVFDGDHLVAIHSA